MVDPGMHACMHATESLHVCYCLPQNKFPPQLYYKDTHTYSYSAEVCKAIHACIASYSGTSE